MARELSVGTWNCFGMAQGAIDAITATRAPCGDRLRSDEVRRVLERPHLMCIQEVMSRDAETLFDSLGVARVRDVNGARLRPLTMRGSGLGIAGRLPLGAHTTRIFDSPRCGWDRLARKGTLHVRVALDGLDLDLINVHLQAGPDAQADAIRALQIGELARRVEQLGSEDRVTIICGDFNVCGLGGTGATYALLRRALPDFVDAGATEDLPTFDAHPDRNSLAYLVEPTAPPQRIDYIFYRGPRRRGSSVTLRHVARILDRPIDASSGGAPRYASDHFGLLATLELG
jgi:endonuclease/exonuclease/phosphatase family metal-dependent hydrolase